MVLKLMDLYPILTETTQVKKGKKLPPVVPRINSVLSSIKKIWQKMRRLWEQFTNRYMLAFDRVNDDALQSLIDEMIRNKDNLHSSIQNSRATNCIIMMKKW